MKLEKLKTEGVEVLTREQLLAVKGGTGSESTKVPTSPPPSSSAVHGGIHANDYLID